MTLVAVLAVPALGALLLALLPGRMDRLARLAAVAISGATFVVSVGLLAGRSSAHSGDWQSVNVRWVPAIGLRLHLGVDGISLPLVLLTTLLTLLCAVYSVYSVPSPGRAGTMLSLVLLTEVGMVGTFLARDLLLFFVFFEVVLAPMYFLIAVWGDARARHAATKFVLYTLLGSVLLLIGLLTVYAAAGTLDMVELTRRQGRGIAESTQLLAFLALFLGLAVKSPLYPLHTWLPDAHTEAPTVGSVLLAGVLLKMGTYGIVRIALPIVPAGAVRLAPALAVLAVAGIIVGALCCFSQTDLKRLVAYSSVGHMGFVMLGIATLTEIGINAAIFGMVAHGVITGMLFFEVGSIYDRYHTRQIAEIGGGMLQKVPYLASIFMFTAIASLGLPGLAGFWGEMTALLSSYNPAQSLSQHVGLFRTLMVFGGIGTVLTAGYFLWTLQRVGMGTLPDLWREKHLGDVTSIEIVSWVPLLVGIVFLGLFPRIVFGTTSEAVAALARLLGG